MSTNRRISHYFRVSAVCVAVVCLAGPAVAQVASALVVEDGTLPGMPGETVDSISNSAVNHAGGYAFTLNSVGSGATLSHAWGNALGGVGSVLRTEGVFGDYDQSSFESFFGIGNAGQVAYSPLSTYIPSGSTSIDGVWLDDNPIMNEEQPYPHLPGYYWSFGSRPGCTADGQPYWVGGITDTQGGSTQIRGLYFGVGATEVLMGGASIGGVAEPVALTALDFDYRVSAFGTNYLMPVDVDSGSTANDGVLVLNGNALTAGGSVVREASPVPVGIGGLAGENWDNFDFMGITEAGSYLVTGDTDADTSMDEFLMINGLITLREGDPVADGVFAGNIEGAYLNENGDFACTWELTNADGNFEALFLNGDLVLMEGDLVDWNNDGMIDGLDQGAFLTDFTGISALTLGDRYGANLVDIYFTADCDVGGSILEGGFRLTVPEPASLSLLLLGALALLRRR
jgi:hypothetical protein